jgi:hypothetical protein
MVWKRFSHEIGFGTGARLERVCIRKNIPDGLNPNKPRWYIEGFSKEGAVPSRRSAKDSTGCCSRCNGLGQVRWILDGDSRKFWAYLWRRGSEHASRSD